MKKTCLKFLDLLFIFLLSLGYFTYTKTVFSINYYVMLGIGLIIDVYYLIQVLLGYKSRKLCFSKTGISKIFILFLPYLIIIFFGTINSFSNDYSLYKYLANLLLLLTIVFAAVCIYGLYGKRSVDILFYAAILNYMAYVISFISTNGLFSLLLVIYDNFVDNDTSWTILEAHEITFSIGLITIYYLLSDFKKNKCKILLGIFFFLFGLKRILLGAMIISLCFVLVYKLLKKGEKYFLDIILTVGTFSASLLYVYLIHSGWLEIIATKLDINFMGRFNIYAGYASEYKFSPLFIGRGLGYVSYFAELKDFKFAIHSDILKLYIEVGFIPMILYFISMFFIGSRLIEKNSSHKNKLIYTCINIITVICYFTDNLLNYYNYLVVLNTIWMCCLMNTQDY